MLRIQSDELHQMHDLVMTFSLGGVELVDVQRLSDDILDRHAGVQRRIRILEYHLHFLAQGMDILVRHQLSVKIELAARRLVQMKQGAADGCLSAAGLTNQSECLTGFDIKGNAVHGLQRNRLEKAGFYREVFLQILDLDEVFAFLFLFRQYASPFPAVFSSS